MTITWKHHALAAVSAVPFLFTSTVFSATATAKGSIMNSSTTATLTAIQGNTTPLTIERIHASPALAGSSPRGLALSPDGKRVTYLSSRADNQHFYDLWQMDIASGKRSILINADQLEGENCLMRKKPAVSVNVFMVKGSWSIFGRKTVQVF